MPSCKIPTHTTTCSDILSIWAITCMTIPDSTTLYYTKLYSTILYHKKGETGPTPRLGDDLLRFPRGAGIQ